MNITDDCENNFKAIHEDEKNDLVTNLIG